MTTRGLEEDAPEAVEEYRAVAEAYGRYRELLREEGLLDFSTLQSVAWGILYDEDLHDTGEGEERGPSGAGGPDGAADTDGRPLAGGAGGGAGADPKAGRGTSPMPLAGRDPARTEAGDRQARANVQLVGWSALRLGNL